MQSQLLLFSKSVHIPVAEVNINSLEALQDADNFAETNEIIIQISTITKAHMGFINSLEQYILFAMEESQDVDPLLLAFGAIASYAQPKVEQEIATFLLRLHKTLTVNTNNTCGLTSLLLAMGNTGSLLVIDVILSYIGSPVSDMQMTAIRALLKFIHLEQVANSLADLLEMDLDEETVILITHTL